MRAEHALEERGRHLVVLRIGSRGLDRDVARAQRGDEVLRIAPALLAQPQRAHRADPGAQHGLGHEARIDELLDDHFVGGVMIDAMSRSSESRTCAIVAPRSRAFVAR